MNPLFLPLLFIFCFFPGCVSNDLLDTEKNHISSEEIQKDNELPFIDLNDSTQIIIDLLKKNDIASVLVPEDASSEDMIDTLIKNFSPAQMAFEAEVLNFADPIIILYYDSASTNHQNILSIFSEIALNQHSRAKFVSIEITKLFSLADQADITTAPTILLINNRSEQGRLENPDLSLLEEKIVKLLDSKN